MSDQTSRERFEAWCKNEYLYGYSFVRAAMNSEFYQDEGTQMALDAWQARDAEVADLQRQLAEANEELETLHVALEEAHRALASNV